MLVIDRLKPIVQVRGDDFCGVYAIVNNLNHKFYIGSSLRCMARITEHMRLLRRCEHHNHRLQKDWIRFDGKKNFEFYEVERCEPEVQFELEQNYLDHLTPWIDEIGYNIAKIANSGGKNRAATYEECQLIRDAYNDGVTMHELADDFGAHPSTIRKIVKAQETYEHLGDDLSRPFRVSDDQCSLVRNAYLAGKSYSQIEAEFEFSATTIRRIVKAQEPYSHLGPDIARKAVVLTDAMVRRMRWERAVLGKTFREIGDAYGVKEGAASDAITGRRHSHIPGALEAPGYSVPGEKNPMAILTDAQVIEFRRRALMNEDLSAMAEEADVDYGVIKRAVTGKTYSYLPNPVTFCKRARILPCETTNVLYIGENNHQSKLSAEDVKEMRRIRRRTGLSFEKIGRRYGVLSRAARRAIQGETWAHITDEPPVTDEPPKQEQASNLNRAQVIEMRRLMKLGRYTYREMAERFGVSFQSARAAAKGETWSHINEIESPFVWKG